MTTLHTRGNMNNVRALVIAAGVVLPAGSALAADIEITFVPSAAQVNVGDTFTVDIIADILNADPLQGEALAGWGMDAVLDVPSLASIDNTTLAPQWTALPDDGDGLAGYQMITQGETPQQVGIELASLELTATAAGTLTIDGAVSDDGLEGFGFVWTEQEGFSAADSILFNLGTVQIINPSVIPLPAPVVMAGLGLLCVGATRLRRSTH